MKPKIMKLVQLNVYVAYSLHYQTETLAMQIKLGEDELTDDFVERRKKVEGMNSPCTTDA